MNSLSTLPAKLLKVFDRVKTTITVTEQPTYNKATRDVSGTPTAHTVTNASPILDAAALFAGAPSSAGTGDGALAYEAVCFLPGDGLAFVPLVGWTVTAGSDPLWRIVEVVKHRVDETLVAAFELRLAR
jgi:hypothetical protein